MARFHFVIPVLSQVMAPGRWLASEASDGGSVEATFDCCLKSLLNQSARDFVIDMVVHEVPPLHIAAHYPIVTSRQPSYTQPNSRPVITQMPTIVIHTVGFPCPRDIDLVTYNRLSGKILPKLPDVQRRRVGEKWHKIKVGLSAALADPEAQWVMFVDSDDLVHRDVVAYALQHDGEWLGGHTVTRGYSWRVGEEVFREVNGFHQICGTCNIVRLAAWEKKQFASTLDVNTFNRKTHWLFAGHASVFRRLRNMGRATAKLPFRAAIYVTGTGFSYSGTKQVGHGRVPLTAELKQQFGIE